MNTFDVSRTLWDYYLWATMLLAVTLAAFLLIRQPARRMALAWATVGGLMALMLLTMIPNWSRYSLASPAPPEPAWADKLEPVLGPAIQQTPISVVEPGPAKLIPNGEPVDVATQIVVIDWGILASGVVLIGSGIIVVWLLLGAWQVRRLRARAEAVLPEVANLFAGLAPRQRVQLGVLAELPVPVAVGLRSPCILLPRTLATSASREQLRSVLAHELAHVEHGDLWLLSLLRMLMVLLWPHPLFWLLRRQVRRDQEILADTAAAELTTRTDYAEQLVALARSAVTMRVPRLASSVGLWESPSQLTQRIKLLLDEKLTILRSCSRRWRLGSAGMLAALALGLSLVTMSPRVAQSQVETETSASGEAATVSPEEFAKLLQQSETPEGFANAVGELVAAAIRPSQLPFISEKRLALIRGKFVNFVTQHMPANISQDRKAELLAGLRDYAQQHLRLPDKPFTRHNDLNNVYLNFPDRDKTLKWELWMALTRGPLDNAALAKLNSQRDWMRKTTAGQPELPHTAHEQVLKDLDAKFADPLCVIFDRPMSDEQFAEFQTAINDWLAGGHNPNSTQAQAGTDRATSPSQLPYMVHHLLIEALYAQYGGERAQFSGPSFDNDEIAGYGASGSYITLSFASNRARQGNSLNLPSIETGGPRISADTGFYADSRSPEQGDFSYSSQDRQLVAFNEAKLLQLEVLDWIAADAIPTEHLKSDLQTHGTESVSFPAIKARLREKFIKDIEQGRVDYPYKGAQNLKEALSMWEAIGPGEGPYVAVLTKEGRVAVVQVQYISGDSKPESIDVRVRVRPNTSVAATEALAEAAEVVAAPPSAKTESNQPASDAETRDSSKLDLQKSLDSLSSLLEPNTISGICFDENEKPLAGVNVQVFVAKSNSNAPPHRAHLGTTDANGKFEFKNVVDIAKEFPEGLPDNLFMPRGTPVVTIVARAMMGRVPGISSNLASEVAKSGMSTPLSMPPAKMLTGRVVDQAGRPIQDAKIVAGTWQHVAGIPADINSAITDAEGRFEIADLEAYDAEQARKEFETQQQDYFTFAGSGMPWDRFATVEHPDFARKREKITSIPGSVGVTLSPGAVLTGQVVTQEAGAEPKPAANVEVTAMLLPSAEEPSLLSFQVLSAKTDEAGNYRFESLPQGAYAVHAYLPDWVSNKIDDVNIATGETVAVPELTMTRGGRVRIQLVDDATGKPLEFAEPTKAYVNPQPRPKKSISYGRPNIVRFSTAGVGETHLPAGKFALHLHIPATTPAEGWTAADFSRVRSEEDLNNIPAHEVVEGETIEVEVRMVREIEPAKAQLLDAPASDGERESQ